MQMNYKKEKINNPQIIQECLEYYSEYFNPSLLETHKNIEEYAKKLSQNATNYILKDDQNQNIGCLIFYNNDRVNKIGFLTLIVVDKLYANQGFGSLLLKEFERECIQNKMTKLKLEVYKDNTHAFNFYRKNGYQILEEDGNSYYMIKEVGESNA